MDKNLSAYLRENEKVCWQGKPSKFPLLEKATKSKIITQWIVVPLVAIGVLAFYAANNPNMASWFIGIVVIAAAAAMASPILEQRKVSAQRYWITDQRVIVESKGNTYLYMNLSAVDAVKLVDDATEQSCLVLGSGIFDSVPKRLRWRACHPPMNTDTRDSPENVEGMVLYDIDNAAAAAEILRQSTSAKSA